jgi:hypothetical protein
LWARYRQANGISDPAQADRLLTPFNHAVGKGERYYQQIAINRAVEGALKCGRRLAAHHGDGHRQDRGCLPDMLEAVECTLENALASTVARASSILPTATSSSISRRMASSRCKSDSPCRAALPTTRLRAFAQASFWSRFAILDLACGNIDNQLSELIQETTNGT